MPVDGRAGKFKTSDDCSIAFNVYSAGRAGAPRIAVIHPLAMSGSLWQGVIESLAGKVEVLTYDCRGQGESERRPGHYTTDLFARDLAELLDHVGWSTAIVAGCSMGGCVAQAFAGRYPWRVEGLGLVDTTAWYGPDAPKTWRERAMKAQTTGLASMIEFQTTRWFGDRYRNEHPDVIKDLTQIFLANDIACYVAACHMLGDADLRHFQPSIRVPVAVAVGEEDYATPVTMARQMHEAIPGSTLTVFSGIRHYALVEAPQKVAAEILSLTGRVVKSS